MPKKSTHNQSHFRVGDAMVHPDRLIISINDEEHTIEPRIMEVLIALASAAQNNEVLSAVNLYIRAWIGRAHAEDNVADPHIDVMQAENPVHKAITHLRKVFGDDPKSPRYIETIRKRGYRLVARVVYQDHYRRVAVARKIWTTGSPYVGLNAFDSSHASVFLGRSRTTGELIEAVRRQLDQQRRLVLVVGASGCGKTSLVNAGAIPILTEKGGYDGLRALSVARCDLAGTRREDALPRLAAALMQWTLDRREIFPPQPVETLAGTLRGQPESLPDTLEDAFRRHASRDMSALSHPHLLLVIDHAEAIVADPSFGSDDHAEIDRFLHHLCESRHICVIVIVRGDFYLALAEALPGMTERKSGDGHVDVLAPRTGEIGDIIRIPAASAGLEFQQHPESKDYVDDVLLRAAVAQPDALPLLQHTLQMLYERRNTSMQLCFDAYQAIGGLEGALAHHAEHVFTGLPGEIQASLDQVLSRMVVMQPENDRVSARRISRGMLDAPAIALAEAFVQARLFVAEHENGDAHYRVAHEALLRQWPRAVEWIRENRRILLARIRLQRAAARWVEEGRRDDHLLNAGRPLEEGLELVELSLASGMGETHEHAFVRKSNDLCNRRKRAKRAAIATLALLTAFSTASAFFAMKSREEAKNRNEEAQRLANFMLGDVAEELRNLGKLEMLHRISSEAVDYLNNREPDKLSASELSNMARAFRSIGEAELEHGDKKSASSAFSRARMTAGIALSKDPGSESAIFERGNASYWIGHRHYSERDYERAEINWREYLKDAKHLSSINPGNPKWKNEHSYALNNLGLLLLRTGKNREAINLFKKSLRLKNDALSMQPDNVEIQYDIIDSASWISSAEESIGNLHSAIAGYESQVEDLKSLISGNSERATWNLRLANFLMLASSVNIDLGMMEEARRQSAESVKILTALSNSENKNTTWSRDLILAHELSARISRIDSDKNSQARHLASASRIIESMNIDDSKSPALRSLRISIEIQKIRLEGHIRTNEIDALSEDFAKIASRHHEDRMRTRSAEIFISNSIQHMESGNEPDSRSSATKALQMLEKCNSREDAKWMALWVLANRLSNSGADTSTALSRLESTGYRNQEIMRLILDQTDTGRMRP